MSKAIKIIPENREVLIVHDCTKEETIENMKQKLDTLGKILTGNGDPEKGLCRKVAIIAERQETMFTKVEEIHESITLFHNKFEEAKGIAVTVQSAFEKYKAEMDGEKAGEEKVSTAKQVNFTNVINIIGTILVVIGLIITVLINKQDKKQIDNKIDNLGTPVIINSRGAPAQLPAGDSLKYFRDGKLNDTMR